MTGPQRTGGDALRRQVAKALTDAGVESGQAEAAELVAHVLGVEPGRLLLIDEVAAADVDRVAAAVARRMQRIPLQHITERAYFAGLELIVGPGVFIPRPETELLAQWATSRLASRAAGEPVAVVDLCSGSGALAVAIAVADPRVVVTAVELSPTARQYLRRNIDALGLADRIRVLAADVTDETTLGEVLAHADVVVANPPYVPASSTVSPEVAHDPPEAVYSGETGMDLIEALAPILGRHVRPGVPVALEHDDTTAGAVCIALRGTGVFTAIRMHDDLAGRRRFVSAIRR